MNQSKKRIFHTTMTVVLLGALITNILTINEMALSFVLGVLTGESLPTTIKLWQ